MFMYTVHVVYTYIEQSYHMIVGVSYDMHTGVAYHIQTGEFSQMGSFDYQLHYFAAASENDVCLNI